MASYIKNTKHPETNKYEPAVWLDDYYGQHRYGVKFEDGKVFNPDLTDLPTNNKQDFDFNKAWENIIDNNK